MNRRRLHQQGQPLSSSALYTLFLAGLTLLYAVYIRPTLLPSKEVFQAVRAFSNTLFSYSQTLKIAEPLHNIFEELSLHCLERMNSRPEQSHPEATKAKEKSAPSDWQEALFGTTNEISQFCSLCSCLTCSDPDSFFPLPQMPRQLESLQGMHIQPLFRHLRSFLTRFFCAAYSKASDFLPVQACKPQTTNLYLRTEREQGWTWTLFCWIFRGLSRWN